MRVVDHDHDHRVPGHTAEDAFHEQPTASVFHLLREPMNAAWWRRGLLAWIIGPVSGLYLGRSEKYGAAADGGVLLQRALGWIAGSSPRSARGSPAAIVTTVVRTKEQAAQAKAR